MELLQEIAIALAHSTATGVTSPAARSRSFQRSDHACQCAPLEVYLFLRAMV